MLRLLGTPHYEGPREVIAGLPEKAFVLAALLAFERGRPVARDRARAVLWESAAEQGAAENLRWLLSMIRKWQRQHAVDVFDIGRRSIGLAAGAVVDAALLLDVQRIETVERLEDIVHCYRGELLAGLDSSAGPLLGETIRGWREQIRRHYVELVRDAAVRIRGDKSERILRELAFEEPHDEELARSLLLRVAADKGATAARPVYDAFARRLREEFGVEPSTETKALLAQLLPETGSAVSSAAWDAAGPADQGIPRIVLLPPETPLPVAPRVAMLADAMVEDVCLQLCRMRTFAMFAPHTARQFAGLEPAAAVAPLGVSYTARTMLMPAAGGGLRLSLSMVRTATGQVVLGDQFDFDEQQIGVRFAELAETIASHVARTIERVEIGAYRHTGSASAYVQYLLGSKVLDSNDLKRLRRARRHFGRALDLEPGYVPAMTGIARTLTKESLALRRVDSDLTARAMALADEAARIDPLDPNAWREKAAASLYLRDIDASLEFLDAALARARHHADIIAEKAEVLVHASRPKEAKGLVLEAMALNPLPPDDYYWILGMSEFFLGRYEPTVTTLLKMKNTDSVSRLIAAAAAMHGDLQTAATYRERWLQIYPDSRLENFTQFMPHASKADVAHYLDALRRAGFP